MHHLKEAYVLKAICKKDSLAVTHTLTVAHFVVEERLHFSFLVHFDSFFLSHLAEASGTRQAPN